MKRRCELLGIGRWAAYQKPCEPNPSIIARDDHVKRRIDYWHTLLPCSGVRKLRKILQDNDGLPVGRKLIRRLMDEMGIHAIYPKPNLSQPSKEHKRFPYLLKNKAIRFPNQVWAVDITYIPMKQGHMYLTAIIDWYSRYIVGWALSDTLDAAPVIEALTDAMRQYGMPGIVNSDQGSQFTSDAYIQLLKENGIRQSMDGKARWIDNVIIERWFRSLKTEYVYINEYASPRELRVGIEAYVQDYNTIRPHQSWDYETPAAVYQSSFINGNIA
jgi:putative transposase